MLPYAEFAYNSSQNRSMKMSPFEVVYGSNPTNVLDFVPIQKPKKVSEDAEEMGHNIRAMHDEVRKRLHASNAKHKIVADQGRRSQEEGTNEDLILLLAERFMRTFDRAQGVITHV